MKIWKGMECGESLDISLLKDVLPEDIEDVSNRYVHMFVEERESDVVKWVHIKSSEIPFYLISLIEHKSNVDYNVVMQVSPMLPIVFYDGLDNWTAAVKLHDRILFSDILSDYVPDYRCILMQLKKYGNVELMQREDELSVIMMIAKLHHASDFAMIGEEVGYGPCEGGALLVKFLKHLKSKAIYGSISMKR